MILPRLRHVPVILLASFLSASIFASFVSVEVSRQRPNHWATVKDQLEQGIKEADAEARAPMTKDHLDRLRRVSMMYWEVGSEGDLRSAQEEFRWLYDWDVKNGGNEYNTDLVHDLRHLNDSYLTFADFKNALWAGRKVFDYDREHGQDGQMPIAIDWNNMGMTYYLSGSVQRDPKEKMANFEHAKFCYKQAEAIMRKLNDSGSLAPNLFNQALLEQEMGNIAESKRIENAARSFLAQAQED